MHVMYLGAGADLGDAGAFPKSGTSVTTREMETKNWNETLCAVLESTIVRYCLHKFTTYIHVDIATYNKFTLYYTIINTITV